MSYIVEAMELGALLYPPQPFEMWMIPFYAILLCVICVGLAGVVFGDRELIYRLMYDPPSIGKTMMLFVSVIGWLIVAFLPYNAIVLILALILMEGLGAPLGAVLMTAGLSVFMWIASFRAIFWRSRALGRST